MKDLDYVFVLLFGLCKLRIVKILLFYKLYKLAYLLTENSIMIHLVITSKIMAITSFEIWRDLNWDLLEIKEGMHFDLEELFSQIYVLVV